MAEPQPSCLASEAEAVGYATGDECFTRPEARHLDSNAHDLRDSQQIALKDSQQSLGESDGFRPSQEALNPGLFSGAGGQGWALRAGCAAVLLHALLSRKCSIPTVYRSGDARALFFKGGWVGGGRPEIGTLCASTLGNTEPDIRLIFTSPKANGKDGLLDENIGPSMYAKGQGLPVKIWGFFANGHLEYYLLPKDPWDPQEVHGHERGPLPVASDNQICSMA